MKSESEDDLKKRFKELCLDLNLDKTSADEAWQSYQRIGISYTLEGDKLQWLACAVYVAGRKCVTQTVSSGSIEGNCVSLTRLLRFCKLSLVKFFNKIKKWSDMANLSAEMRQKVDHLERNFNVSTVTFMKYKPIFDYVFKSPTSGTTKQTKNRKQNRKQLVTPGDVFAFCWTLFVHIKSNFTQISDDLVNSYHLLLATIDFCYANALCAENAQELLSPDFSELPKNFYEDNFKAAEKPDCVIQALCDKWSGIYLDAKGIKEHWAKPYIKRLFEKDLLRSKNMNQYGIFDSNYFEYNMKSITKEYDQFVLNIGDFDEGIFLCENANEELGTTQCNVEELSELMQRKQQSTLKQSNDQHKPFFPTTPLSNRHYLNNKVEAHLTPISNATQSVSRIQSLLLGRKDEPSAELEKLFSEFPSNPREAIINRVKAMGDRFVQAYCQPSADDIQTLLFDSQTDEFAKKRLSLAVTLYYKVLENILMREKKIAPENMTVGLSGIISAESFHISLFACSLEIILFCYTTNRTFPWILEVFGEGNELRLQPFYFYKVIEPVIRDEDGLSREIVKHLNSVEEKILESFVWKSSSPLWELIKQNGPIPSCAEVSLPSQVGDAPVLSSPSRKIEVPTTITNSPMTDRFTSPSKPMTAKRQLFVSGKKEGGVSQSGQIVQIAIPTQTSTGEIKYIQVPAIALNFPQQQQSNSTKEGVAPDTPQKMAKVGALGLFFRKIYNLAGLRLRDLCDRLNINEEELKSKIWTCLEYTFRRHIELLRDRHMDQMMMCACYSICKVTKQSQTFQEIMNCYRKQPQCNSHVYRSVLLNNRKRRNSGSSDTSRTSGSSSPILQEEKDRIRSSSTLPVPHPNSQPPTPTRVAGTGTHFEFEERGDVIMFYNNVYLPELTKYIMKFTNSQNLNNASPPLSPLPRLHATAMSPYRRISSKHSVYISPLKTANFPPSPNRPMSYRFLSSPAKDLQAINNMMKSGTPSGNRKVSKRILQDDTETENSPTKRQCTDIIIKRKLDNVVNERQNFSGANGDLISD